jgi:hypothetical protein
VKTEPSKIRERLRSLLGAPARREQDASLRRAPRALRASSGRDGHAEPVNSHFKEVYP